MKIAIMQPYFLPYIGYFQLANAVDKFVVYDNIQYTKKGWINRNRIVLNGREAMMTLPLRKDSDYLDIGDRELSDVWLQESDKLLNRISGSYKKAPYFDGVFPLMESIVHYGDRNLFGFVLNSLASVFTYLKIETPIIASSTLSISPDLKGEDRVIALCHFLKAEEYINPIGGMELYSKEQFREKGVELIFHRVGTIEYEHPRPDFLPNLSILDVLMYNSSEVANDLLTNGYELI